VSGVHPWLGPIDCNASLGRLKYGLGSLQAGGTPDTGNLNFWADEGTPWVAISDMSDKDLVRSTNKTLSAAGLADKRLVPMPRGTLLYSMYASLGHVAELDVEAVTNQAILGLTFNNKLNGRFAFWQLKALQPYVVESASSSTQDNLNAEKVRNLPLVFPQTADQERIANFLDDKTARIDALIAEKERLVERILEYRQSVATTAVTQGVPGEHLDLVPHSFLGPIPKSWRAGKFRHYVQFRSGQVDPEADSYLDMPLIAPNHIESGTGRLIEIQSSRDQAAESGKYWCDSGDVIYSKIRPALRKATLAPFDCLCSADMYPLKGQSGLSNSYLFWYLLSEPFSNFAVQESVRVAMPKLNRETLAGAFVPLPPPEEQDRIVSFIEEKISAIDQVVENAKEHLTRLREYRSSLISAAVTGQLDITNYETEAV
jgi:type I restriction enzyme, S subunit